MDLEACVAVMMRGCCSRHRVAEQGCATCEPVFEAVDYVRGIHRRMVEAEAKVDKPAFLIIDDLIKPGGLRPGELASIGALGRYRGAMMPMLHVDTEHKRTPFHHEDLMDILVPKLKELPEELVTIAPRPHPLRYKTILAIVAVLRGARA